MRLLKDETEIRQALIAYIEDPGLSKYNKLTYIVLGAGDDMNLFEALVAYADRPKETVQGFSFVVNTVVC